ncbi:tetraspanin-32 isoform X1 [Ornithorhynchus anatinus]|uniref:tetraspanin-32 isoform X1 n=1 Tax=Ornithorhynchus anatinus TaxID=9258 RepID=UPI0010A940B8|nr:tetraspanin-32 isoform X1 [Ornithorhynchus anatinus]
MGAQCRVRGTKCQLLATCFFVLLLGLSVAILTVITRSGAHFTVLSRASGDGSPYRVLHSAAFYLGTCLAGLLGLGAVLSAAGTVREAAGLVAGGFLCFALVFCTLIQVAFWRHTNRSQVEDAVLDAYDLVYEMAMRNSSGGLRQLEAIHDTYLCCGKNSPFGGPGSLERDLCPGAGAPAGGGPPSPPGGPPGGGGATGKDCLREIRRFLARHVSFASALLAIALGFMVYELLLTSFLCFAIRSHSRLDRRGRYVLAKG